MSQIVWIARHANRLDFVNPEWFNTAERRYDPPLSADGFLQAQELAERLKGERINHVFASPFLRTVQTANQVAEILDLPLKLEWGLCEWLNPEWMTEMPETLPPDELARKFPRIDLSYHSRIVPKYPEYDPVCLERAGETARQLAEEFSGEILLVGHGASVIGATMGLAVDAAETELSAGLCCLYKLVRQGEKWDMELKGDRSHLREIEAEIRFF
ncbi:histidine phosphatase family protein [Laspinema palackyanum]|uniref:histidine phosphatase family protein n=1 Tax=Laspinema palackyanum TaxID=3231601 RepID=UPI00345D710E|nr:histidine phosphatase family protein [Laspinema sp. D2c]